MKRRALLRLTLSLLLIAAFVIGATILEASNSLNPAAWYWAQRQLPVLWAVDAFALLALVPVCGFAVSQDRLLRKSEEIGRVRDEHQAQLDSMIRNAERTDQVNAEQADQIQSLQQTIAELTRKLEALETHTAARQQAMETEARVLAEQAFAALTGQVEANTRQMEAVNLAMQYQRAEIKQLRQGVRAAQRHHEIIDVAGLTPGELAALEGGEADALLRLPQTGEGSQAGEYSPEEEAPDVSLAFAPTMNAQSTIISPLTAYSVAPLAEERGEAETADAPPAANSPGSDFSAAAEPRAPRDGAASSEVSASGVTEEEYRLLTTPLVVKDL